MKTCQHCQTELSNPRAKNCADCMALKNGAQKAGFYREALAALEHAGAEGLTGGEYRARAQEVYAELVAGRQVALRRRREDATQREADRKAAKREREATNARLREHGYRWQKVDAESMDFAGAGAFDAIYGDREFVWELSAPDGRTVTVEQALAEIEGGMTEDQQAEAYVASLTLADAMTQLRTGKPGLPGVSWIKLEYAILNRWKPVERFAALTGLSQDLIQRVLDDARTYGGWAGRPRHAAPEETVQVQEAFRQLLLEGGAGYAIPATGEYTTTRGLLMALASSDHLTYRLASAADL